MLCYVNLIFLKEIISLHFIIAIQSRGLSSAYNECDFLYFDTLVIYHLNSAYLRFYKRYLNNLCIVRNLILRSKNNMMKESCFSKNAPCAQF